MHASFDALIPLLGILGVTALTIYIINRASLWFEGTVVREGERGIVYRHGKYEQELGPGRHFMLFGRKATIVSVAEQTLVVSGQEVLSADRLPVKISALAAYRITDARRSLEQAAGGHMQAVYYGAQLALRDIAAAYDLEALIDKRTMLDDELTAKAAAVFAEHGCTLTSLSIRDVVLPTEVRRLANDVARAKMETSAALERARGEQAALRALSNAARLLKGNPELMNLRVLQALSTGPGKAAPTVILNGGAGIVPVSTAQDAGPTES